MDSEVQPQRPFEMFDELFTLEDEVLLNLESEFLATEIEALKQAKESITERINTTTAEQIVHDNLALTKANLGILELVSQFKDWNNYDQGLLKYTSYNLGLQLKAMIFNHEESLKTMSEDDPLWIGYKIALNSYLKRLHLLEVVEKKLIKSN